MLIIALVLALIGLVALVFAVVTSNELVAWVCIGASVLGVVLLIIDAVRERQQRDTDGEDDDEEDGAEDEGSVDYPEEVADEDEQHHGDQDATAVNESSETRVGTSEESTVSAEGRGDDRAK
jgi:hypothetical protein